MTEFKAGLGKARAIAAAAGGLLLAALAAPALRAAPSTETVTSVTLGLSTTTGLGTSIALDNRNGIHVVYWDPSDQKSKYVYHTNGSAVWASTMTVDTLDHVHSTGTVMALDAFRQPHVVFYDAQDTALKYTRYNGTSWSAPSLIETFVSSAPFPALALNASNLPRVLYSQTETTTTKLAIFDGALWTRFTVEFSSMAAPGALVVDAAGRTHAAWSAHIPVTDPIATVPPALSTATHLLVYGQETTPGSGLLSGNFWRAPSEILGTTITDRAGNVSLALDENGVAHISAFNEEAEDLWYITGTTGTLVFSTVTATGRVGRASAIRVDSDGNPVVAGWDDGVGVKVWRYTPADPVSVRWSTTTVHASTGAGPGVALALNFRDSAFLSYFESGAAPLLQFGTTAERGLSVSGTVRDGAAAPMPGVTVSISGHIAPAAAVTPAGGTFSFTDLFEGNYVVAPSLAGHGFSPAFRTHAPLLASQGAQDFVGGPVGFSAVDNLINPALGQTVTLTASVLPGHLFVGVYDLGGRLVRRLVDEEKPIGSYPLTWDGRNAEGEIVSSGIYLVRVKGAGVEVVEKVAVVK